MDEQKLLEAIRAIVKEETQPINDRLTNVENKLEVLEIKQNMTHKKLNDLQLDSKVSERAIRKDIAKLRDGQDTLVTVLEAKDILPKVL